MVSCTQAKSATDPTEMSLLKLGQGEYFGEMALMLDEPRAANCIATEGKVWGRLMSSYTDVFIVVISMYYCKRGAIVRCRVLVLVFTAHPYRFISRLWRYVRPQFHSAAAI